MKPTEKNAHKPRTLSGQKPVPFKDVVQKLLETRPQRDVKIPASSRKIKK